MGFVVTNKIKLWCPKASKPDTTSVKTTNEKWDKYNSANVCLKSRWETIRGMSIHHVRELNFSWIKWNTICPYLKLQVS